MKDEKCIHYERYIENLENRPREKLLDDIKIFLYKIRDTEIRLQIALTENEQLKRDIFEKEQTIKNMKERLSKIEGYAGSEYGRTRKRR